MKRKLKELNLPEREEQDFLFRVLFFRYLFGDKDAENEICVHLIKITNFIASNYYKDEDDKEDAAQIALAHFWQQIRKYNGQFKFITWAGRILTNAIISHKRKQNKKFQVKLVFDTDLLYSDESDENRSPEDVKFLLNPNNFVDLKKEFNLAASCEEILLAVEALEPHTKIIFKSLIQGLTIDEIAAKTGWHQSTINAHIQVGRIHLGRTLCHQNLLFYRPARTSVKPSRLF